MLDFSPFMRVPFVILIALSISTALVACGGLPPFPLGDANPSNQLSYDGAIAISIRSGTTFPGTTIGYKGKTPDGRALMTIAGQEAPKSTADSVAFAGSPIPGTVLNLNTRVGTYDNNAVNLFGTIHLSVTSPAPQMGPAAGDAITAFGIPVQYSVNKGNAIPGSTIQFVGKTDQGAQFTNVDGYPYRQQLDSVVWTGHLRSKVGLHLDLRLISFSEDSATLVGTAQVQFER